MFLRLEESEQIRILIYSLLAFPRASFIVKFHRETTKVICSYMMSPVFDGLMNTLRKLNYNFTVNCQVLRFGLTFSSITYKLLI